jgi:hypothetical protein
VRDRNRGPADIERLTPKRGRWLARIDHDVLHPDQLGNPVGSRGKDHVFGMAMREGVKAFVVGRVSNIAGSWGLNVELVGAESGEVLAAVREPAADSTGLIDAVDRASETLRHRLGESLRDLRALPPLAQE